MTSPIHDAIVLLGDSITEQSWMEGGISQRLARDYVRKLDVVNRGFGGFNTKWAIYVFRHCLVPRAEQETHAKMRLLTIWYGANDATLPFSIQHIPLDEYKKNLSVLINLVASPDSEYYSPVTKIILISPPPFNAEQWKEHISPGHEMDREFENTRRYAEAVKDVGTQEGLPVVDAWQAIWDAAGREETGLPKFLSDGLHLTSEGYTLVYDELIKTIKEQYPGLYQDRLRNVFVPWDEIDVDNLPACLEKRNIDG